MSFQLVDRVLTDATIENRSQVLVMLALARYASDDGKCWPSISSLARLARLTVSPTKRAIRELEKTGHLMRSWHPEIRTRLFVLYPVPAGSTPAASGPPPVSLQTGGGAATVPARGPLVAPESIINQSKKRRVVLVDWEEMNAHAKRYKLTTGAPPYKMHSDVSDEYGRPMWEVPKSARMF